MIEVVTQSSSVLQSLNMECSKMELDLQLANEVIQEDLEPELRQDLNFYQNSSRSGSRTSSCSTEHSVACGHSYSGEGDYPAHIYLLDEQETTSADLWPRSNTCCNDQCHLVPSLSYNVREKNLEDTCQSFWDAKDRHKCPTSCPSIECHPIIKTEQTESYCEVPDITEQLNMVKLVDKKDLPLYLQQETFKDHLHVDFLNLKSLYYIKNFKSNTQRGSSEESEVYIYLKASLKIEQVKVYLKELEIAPTSSNDLFELQISFDQHKGLLKVDLSLLSSSIISEHTGDLQLYVVTQFEDGNLQCCCSCPFQIQTQSFSDGYTENSSCYQLHGIQMNIRDDQCLPCTPPRHSGLEESMVNICGTKAKEPDIQLLTGSNLTLNNIQCELGEEDDVLLIQEQPELPGLLKLVKKNSHRDPMGRRRANGFRSAEETFLWVCGHCFFRRLKKSTVKSHVSRNVCRRNKRIYAESQFKGNKRPVIRRSNTYPITLGRKSSYDDFFESKTP